MLAAELGFRFWPERDTSHDEEYSHFEIFRQGRRRAAYNRMYGEIKIAGLTYLVKMGDFKYIVPSNDSSSTYRFSYVIFHPPFYGVPDLLIREEGVLDKLASVIGFDDINFESSEFSRKFLVKSPDKRFAFDIVHPRMMEFLLQRPAPMVDIERDRVCIIDGEQVWSAAKFRHTLRWAESFFELWPEHVIADHTSRHGARR